MLNVFAVILAKGADGVKMRLLVRGEIAKPDVPFEEAVNLARTANTLLVSESKYLQHHLGVILWRASVHVGFFGMERFESFLFSKIVEGVGDELFETIFFDPLSEVFGKEMLLVLIVSENVEYQEWNLTKLTGSTQLKSLIGFGHCSVASAVCLR